MIGLSGPEFEVPLERGKIREFAASVGSYLPDYLEDPHPIVPPTYLLMSAYFWGYLLERPGDTDLARIGADKMMSLDGGQSFTYHGPLPRAGETLTARTFVEDVWQKQSRSSGRLSFIKMCSTFKNAAGETVADWRPVSVVPERAPDNAVAVADDLALPPFMRRDERRDQFLALPRQNRGQLTLGEGPGAIALPGLTLTEVVRYQFASGEDSPGHHDVAAARAFGFPTWFSVGMLHAGYLATYAVAWLDPKRIRFFDTKMTDIVWPGDELTYEGWVTDLSDEHVTVNLDCKRGEQSVVSGRAGFRLCLETGTKHYFGALIGRSAVQS